MVALVTSVGVAVELGKVYLAKTQAQQAADQSALSAALAYTQTYAADYSASVANHQVFNSSTAQTDATTSAQTAGCDVAAANYIYTCPTSGPGLGVYVTIGPSPLLDGNQAAIATVTSAVSLSPFNAFVWAGPTATVTVSATGYVELEPVPCMTGMNAGGLVSVAAISSINSGSFTATGCAVASGGGIATVGGGSITASAIEMVGTANPGSSYQTLPTANLVFSGSSQPVDPFVPAAGLLSPVFARLPTVAAYPATFTAPAPLAIASSTTCANSSVFLSGTSGVTLSDTCTLGGSITASGTYSFGPGTYTIPGIVLSGANVTITASNTGTASTVFYVNTNGINLANSAVLTMSGNVTLQVAGGIQIANAAATLSPGTYIVTSGDANNTGIDISNFGTLAFAGTGLSTFDIANGISNSGGSATFPDGSYVITSSNGTAGITNASTTTFGNGSFIIAGGIDNTGTLSIGNNGTVTANSTFEVVSPDLNNNAIYDNGSLTIGNGPMGFPNVDLSGSVSLDNGANVTLGPGTYTISAGTSDGTPATIGGINACGGGSGSGNSVTGLAVSIVTNGTICFGQGFPNVTLSPSVSTISHLGNPATIVLASDSPGASQFYASPTGDFQGVLYLPQAPLTLSGSSSGNGDCLIVLAETVTLNGSAITTTCPSLDPSAVTGVALVQ